MSDKIMLKLFRNLKKFIKPKNNKDKLIKPKNNKDDFISDNNIYRIYRYFALADYSFEDIVIFVNNETLKSIKRDNYYKVKEINLSENSVMFNDGNIFAIEKIDNIEELV